MKGNGESKTGLGSGRGVMVPMGPSSTSDGSQYLGRPRRYKYTGSSGQPSMSADSGFSSVDGLGRVNKGYDGDDEYCHEPMFPVQDDEWDEEMDEDDYFLRTRKIPIYSLGSRPRRRQEKLNPLKEGFIPGFVEDFAKSIGLSAPGIDVLIGKMIIDREAEAGNFAIEEMCRIMGVDSGIVSTAMIDADDDPMINIIQHVCNLGEEDRIRARDQFREFLESLKDSIVTLVQAYDSVFALVAGQLGPQIGTPEEIATVPAVNFVSGISGFFVRALPIERLIFNLSSKLAQMFTGVMEISDHIESVSPRYGEAMGRLEAGFGPVFSAIRQKPALSLSRLGSLYSALDGDTSLCSVNILPLSDEAALEVEDETLVLPPESAGVDTLPGSGVESLPVEDGGVEVLSSISDVEVEDDYFPESQNCLCPISESRFMLLENRYNRIARNLKMSESTLREFVREMLLETKKKKEDENESSSRYGAPGYLPSDVLPYGQDYITDEEQEEREEIADEYAVSYKGDLGYGAHSARPRKDTLSEIALRRIIRRELSESLSSIMPPKLRQGLATAGIAGTIGGATIGSMGALSHALEGAPESAMQDILDNLPPEERIERATDIVKGSDDQVNNLPDDLRQTAYQVASDYLDSPRAQEDLSLSPTGTQSDISVLQTQPMQTYYETREVTRFHLQRMIREEAKKLLSNDEDSKKKDEEEQDEAATIAGMGSGIGPVTPLGTGPSGGKKTSMTPADDGARERSIYANERGYGGGRRSSTWMTYPVKGY